MNMMYLDADFKKLAEYHVDKHVIKLTLEATQLLSNAHNILGSSGPYKVTHINHPLSLWVRESKENYLWACEYGLALCEEYSFRYGKEHKCFQYLKEFTSTIPQFNKHDMTDYPCCMPIYYILDNPIESYRNYYNMDKRHLFTWTGRVQPFWVNP